MILRPATSNDKTEIIGLTKGIWGGNDYMPTILDSWFQEGGVYVGVVDDCIVGVSRIVRFGPGEWWLEGLRVGVQFQGKGYGKTLNQLTIEEVRRIGTGMVRFSTADSNRSVPLANQSGFRELIHLPFCYLELCENKPAPNLVKVLKDCNARLLTIHDASLSRLLTESCEMHYAGFLQEGWEFHSINQERLSKMLGKSVTISTEEGGSEAGAIVLTLNEHYPQEGCVSILAGPPEAVEKLMPCIIPALLHLDKKRREVDGGIPSCYLDAALRAGFSKPNSFTDLIIFEMEL